MSFHVVNFTYEAVMRAMVSRVFGKNKIKAPLHKNIPSALDIISYRKTGTVEKKECLLPEAYYFRCLTHQLSNKAVLTDAGYSVYDSTSIDNVPIGYCIYNMKYLQGLTYNRLTVKGTDSLPIVN